VTFRGRLTLFLCALVLAPLAAGGIAAHVLAERHATRDAEARLQRIQLTVERVRQHAFDVARLSLTGDVARRAFRASHDALEHLRASTGLGFLFVVRGGLVRERAMGSPLFAGGLRPTARSILEARGGTLAPVEEKQMRVGGAARGLVVGGVYLDRRFLREIPGRAMAVLAGHVTATTAPNAPATVQQTGYWSLPDGRAALCVCSSSPPSGIAILGDVPSPGLFPGLQLWILVLAGAGVVLGGLLAFELARVLSGPHERALGRLAETERLSVTDGLTGVANRRFLEATLTEECTRSGRYGRVFSVLMVDVDHFKQVNDAYGHSVGDRVLIEIAHRIRNVLRFELDTVARYGGEEFAVVLPETTRDGAVIVAEKVRRSVSEIALQEGLHLTVSVGVASCPEDAADPAGLLRAADRAMYEAKRSGRDRVVAVAEGSPRPQPRRRLVDLRQRER
jgi:diguanylate cyclase (GGDEF)-like protein